MNDTLTVPGAELYYTVSGSGPTLLLICGGVYDADAYGGLASQLVDRYTVVTYDRRGNSRSPLDGPPTAQTIEVHADDAHRILAATSPGQPAYVFGNSSGAMIALELATRHPEQVRVVVAHEPPVFQFLDDPQHWAELMTKVEQAYTTDGPEVAGAIFGAGLQMRGGDDSERVPGGGDAPAAGAEPDPATLEMMGRMARNMEFFIGYEVPPFGRWAPDVAALKATGVPVVMAAGADSAGEPPNLAATAVGDRLGAPTVVFPGDHGGFGQQVDAFAATLTKAFDNAG